MSHPMHVFSSNTFIWLSINRSFLASNLSSSSSQSPSQKRERQASTAMPKTFSIAPDPLLHLRKCHWPESSQSSYHQHSMSSSNLPVANAGLPAYCPCIAVAGRHILPQRWATSPRSASLDTLMFPAYLRVALVWFKSIHDGTSMLSM